MYTDGNPCDFFSSHFFWSKHVKTYAWNITAEHTSVLLFSHSSPGTHFGNVDGDLWYIPWGTGNIRDMPHLSTINPGHVKPRKKTNLVQDSQDKLQVIYTFDIHGFAPPIPIFSHHFPVFSPLHRNHFLVHPIFERPTSSHHLTRLQRKPQTGISRWGVSAFETTSTSMQMIYIYNDITDKKYK